ncbi:hypothetical protein D9M69_531850 [compost metagenome]
MGLGPTALILHGIGAFPVISSTELDHIGHAHNAQLRVEQGHGGNGAYTMTLLHLALVSALVEQAPFGGLPVFRPQSLDMNQCALARAVEVVLQGGQGDEIVVFHVCPLLALEVLAHADALGQGFRIDADAIILEAARRCVHSTLHSLDLDAVEQHMGGRIAHSMLMLEDNQLARGHLATCR